MTDTTDRPSQAKPMDPMNKDEALALIRSAKAPVEPGRAVNVERLRPGDGLGVAGLFEAVYGELYPVDMYYIPSEIERANADGRLITAVARLDDGRVVAQAALYRSSPPNPRLYEFGQMITLPEYRTSRAMHRLVHLLMDHVHASPDIDGAYAETVTNHIITQKHGQRFGYRDTALEPALMPAGAYAGEGAADRRVGCVLSFFLRRDRQQTIHLPPAYLTQARAILDGAGLVRTLESAAGKPAPDGPSSLDTRRFESAGVVRSQVGRVGGDFEAEIAGLEGRAEAEGYALLQCFVAVDDPAGAQGVETLRRRGWFMGGLVPAWFGPDGWLMQKLYAAPEFEHMLLHTPQAAALREMAREDWSRTAP
jgi:RimJ/RimL family protein N-acetyltransferase